MASALRIHSLRFGAILFVIFNCVAYSQNPQKPAKEPPKRDPSPFERRPVEDDAPLIADINNAITRGENWLLEIQGPEGSWQNEERSARIGYTELALYAISNGAEALPGTVDKDSKKPKNPPKPAGGGKAAPQSPEEHARLVSLAINRGFDFVKKNPWNETYALSLLLLAMDTYHAPRWERSSLAKMTADARQRYRFPRLLSEADKNWTESVVKELLEHRFKGLWSYTKNSGTGDISNTQFALLGLRAAANCGSIVDPRVWDESLDYFIKYQDRTGPKSTFPLPRPGSRGDGTLDIVSIEAMQRSWGYSFHPGGPVPDNLPNPTPKKKDKPVVSWSFGATGTHTSIGIASLQIIRDELARSMSRKKDASFVSKANVDNQKIDFAIRDGVGWLAAHWNLEEDPGGGFPFYYLYSIERVGALLGERFVAGHDWYREGAEILLRRQLKNGAWPSDIGEVNAFGSPDVTATAFALLFLHRATTPSIVTPDFGENKK
ncbi:MAG: hypothetical protein HY286_18500 [Planctomycetes bacterium]|nr:hypothetical protein [Planctomycetota bacterium]